MTPRSRDLYLYNTQYPKETHNHAPVDFEPAIPASQWPKAYHFNRAATAIDSLFL